MSNPSDRRVPRDAPPPWECAELPKGHPLAPAPREEIAVCEKHAFHWVKDQHPGCPTCLLVQGEVRVTDPVTGGQKGQKFERFDLIPADALTEEARVYGFGAAKYADNNWLKGYKYSLSLAALFRHLVLWTMGQSHDKESGLHHLMHVKWHCNTLFVFETRKLGTDDIPTRKVT